MQLAPVIEKFVLHFGEMGGRWGINRTVGQIYALLFLSDRPLNAEEITEALGVSRSQRKHGHEGTGRLAARPQAAFAG